MKKAIGLSLNVVVIAALILLALTILIVVIFGEKMKSYDEESKEYCNLHPNDGDRRVLYGCIESGYTGHYACKCGSIKYGGMYSAFQKMNLMNFKRGKLNFVLVV